MNKLNELLVHHRGLMLAGWLIALLVMTACQPGTNGGGGGDGGGY